MISNEICFRAEFVEAYEKEYMPDNIVHGIYFGMGDPEEDGEHWHFSCSSGNEDGICTVKEIQQITVYGGIVQCEISHNHLSCTFDEQAAQKTQTRRLHIDFEVDDAAWEQVKTQASHVFQSKLVLSN